MATDPARASPWPLLLALGLAAGEVGVVLDSFVLAVGGIGLFGASLAGQVAETGYVASRSKTLGAVAAVFTGLGALVVVTTTFRTRGLAVVAAGGLLFALAVIDQYRHGGDPSTD